MQSIYNLGTKLLWAVLLTCSVYSQAAAAIPTVASQDSRYALGYLVCDHYANVESNGTGNSTSDLNTCIRDAYLNQLVAYLEVCNGVYMINDTLQAYEWAPWNSSQNRMSAAPINNNVLRGAKCTPTTRPEIKLMTTAPLFDNINAVRPMVAYRTFGAINEDGIGTPQPSHPLATWTSNTGAGDPPNYREQGSIGFYEIFEGIDLHTNGHDGAIGITMQSAQGGLLANTTITATDSIAGIFNPPGRNSLTTNVEIIGGDYCVLEGQHTTPNIQLAPTIGILMVGMTCTNPAKRAFLFKDVVPPVLVGFNITKSSNGPAIENLIAGVVLKDGMISLSGSASGDVAIQNVDAAGTGWNVYVANVFVSGTTQMVLNGPTVTAITTGSGTWTQIVEHVYTDQYQEDGSTAASIFPNYSGEQGRFEARSLIAPDGGAAVLSGADLPINNLVRTPAITPPSDLLTRHVWSSLPSFEDGYINPTGPNCTAYPGYDYRTAVTQQTAGNDCLAEINAAITAAAATGHKNVVIPRGAMLISGPINELGNVHLIGAGPRKSAIAYKESWAPTTALPFIQTTNSTTATPYVGFMSLYIKTAPFANDFMYHMRWRSGKNSMTAALDFNAQFKCVCSGATTGACPGSNPNNTNQPRYSWWFSNNGGGRHYGNTWDLIKNFDRNTASRTVFIQGTSQALSIYGFNVEGAKTSSACGLTQANTEITGSANVRTYGSKHEGGAAILFITASTNIGSYGWGAMVGPGSSGSGIASASGVRQQ